MSFYNNNNEIPLKLPKVLEDSGIIHKFVINTDDKYVKLRLNSKVNPPIALDASTDIIKEKGGWKKFTDGFSNDLKKQKLEHNYNILIISTINENGDLIRSISRTNSNSSSNSQQQKQKQNENDVKETREYYNAMLAKFQKSVVYSESPKMLAYKKGVEIVKNFKNISGIALQDLFELMCKDCKQLATYFGYDNGKSLKIQDNRKVSEVKKLLLNHSNIKRVQDNPIVLKWFDDDNNPQPQSDTPDISDKENYTDQQKKMIKKIIIFMKMDQNPCQVCQICRIHPLAIMKKNLSKEFNFILKAKFTKYQMSSIGN